jgi:DNA-binding transcriptional LysR family regulator
MNVRQLEIFHAIMKAGSMTEAARNLNVSQPAVSAMLKHTEGQLGMKLFQRINGRLHPTPEALSLLPEAEAIFARIDGLNRIAQDLKGGRAGQIAVAASPTLVNAFLPKAVALFRQTRPLVRFNIQSLPTPQVVERVVRREVDLALVYAPADDPAVEVESLAVLEIACVMPRDHALSARAAVEPQDLAQEPVITYGPQTPLGSLIDTAFRDRGHPPPPIAVQASSAITACLMTSHGAGIALVDPSFVVSRIFPDLVVKPFRPTVDVRVQLMYARDRPRSRLAMQFADQLRQLVPSRDALFGGEPPPIRPRVGVNRSGRRKP